MKENNRKLILYIATSLDGYIAGPNDDLGFLDAVQQEGEDYGYESFVSQVDTIIIGRRTYDWVMDKVGEFPHKDKPVYVITSKNRDSIDNITFYNGSLTSLVEKLGSKEGKNIYCDGGAHLVNELLKEKLIDEMIISVIPVLLGDGIRLFEDGRPQEKLKLVSAASFEKGLVQLRYEVN